MDGGPPALVIQEELERVEIVSELEVQFFRNVIAPSEKIDGVTTGDLISIRHDEQVIIGYASDADKLIQGDTLVGFLNKRVLALDESPRKGAIREPGLDEVEAIPVLGE